MRIPVNAADHLHAWWIPTTPSRKTILIFHGNAEALEDLAGEADSLHALGALDELVRRRKIPLGKVVVLGRSIGSGPATQLAYENAELGGVVLESPLRSVEDVAEGSWYFRVFPLHLMLRTHFR